MFAQSKVQTRQVHSAQPFSNFDGNRTAQNWFDRNCKKSVPMRPCEKYGLDPRKLEIEGLMKFRTYRRLYNIVANDQTQSDFHFRPNLIKEMYFLLQITPIIEESLKQDYLNKIQQFYNSNDHKKIKLSKNLAGKVSNVLHTKPKAENPSKQTTSRPKTGVQWDKTLSSFLRPYTAKIRNNTLSQNNQKISRPQSSKFGVSTNPNTEELEEDSKKAEFGNLANAGIQFSEIQQISDIEEEWERSLDFKKKHRTLHPQQKPTFQQLMSIINLYKHRIAPAPGPHRPSSSSPPTSNHTLQLHLQLQQQKQNARKLAQQQIQLKQQLQGKLGTGTGVDDDNIDDGDIDINQDQDQDQDQELDHISQSNGENGDQVGMLGGVKGFSCDRRTRQGRNLVKGKDRMYSNLNGVKILRPFTAKENHVLTRLDNYSHLLQNKRVVNGAIDAECAEQYRDFMRKKNTLKRQSLRKSQSKTYIDRLRKSTKILAKTPQDPQDPHDPHDPQKQKQKTQYNENPRVYNFSLNTQGNQMISPNSKSTYNVRHYFSDVKKRNILGANRWVNSLVGGDLLQQHAKSQKMTYVKRFNSEDKFNPVHPNNLDIMNKQTLEDIQKIKSKLGGKLVASTDTLMKALYIDTSPDIMGMPFYTRTQQSELKLPDKKYLMMQRQTKKKPKKKRKGSKILAPRKKQ